MVAKNKETNTDVRLAVLERDFHSLSEVVARLETNIEKLTNISTNVERLLAVQENANQNQRSTNEQYAEMFNEMKEDNKHSYARLCEKIDKMGADLSSKINNSTEHTDNKFLSIEERVIILEKWRWLIIGGAASASFLFSFIVNYLYR